MEYYFIKEVRQWHNLQRWALKTVSYVKEGHVLYESMTRTGKQKESRLAAVEGLAVKDYYWIEGLPSEEQSSPTLDYDDGCKVSTFKIIEFLWYVNSSNKAV